MIELASERHFGLILVTENKVHFPPAIYFAHDKSLLSFEFGSVRFHNYLRNAIYNLVHVISSV
jgi:hypothetical protein